MKYHFYHSLHTNLCTYKILVLPFTPVMSAKVLASVSSGFTSNNYKYYIIAYIIYRYKYYILYCILYTDISIIYYTRLAG